MVDLLGPGDAGSINTLTTTSDVSHPIGGDTWFQDCVGGDASSGTPTPIMAKWLNWILQQDRAAIRFSNVSESNAYDYMLSWAIQSGFANFIGFFAGSANALTGASPNSPQTIQAGTLIRGIAAATNTGAATFNWSGLGAQPIVDINGAALTGGEITTNQRLLLMWDGSAWVLVSPPSHGWLNTYVTNLIPPPFAYGDIGSGFVGYQDKDGVFHGPTDAGLTGTWSLIPSESIPLAYGAGGVNQGTIYNWKRVS